MSRQGERICARTGNGRVRERAPGWRKPARDTIFMGDPGLSDPEREILMKLDEIIQVVREIAQRLREMEGQ